MTTTCLNADLVDNDIYFNPDPHGSLEGNQKANTGSVMYIKSRLSLPAFIQGAGLGLAGTGLVRRGAAPAFPQGRSPTAAACPGHSPWEGIAASGAAAPGCRAAAFLSPSLPPDLTQPNCPRKKALRRAVVRNGTRGLHSSSGFCHGC